MAPKLYQKKRAAGFKINDSELLMKALNNFAVSKNCHASLAIEIIETKNSPSWHVRNINRCGAKAVHILSFSKPLHDRQIKSLRMMLTSDQTMVLDKLEEQACRSLTISWISHPQ